MNSGGCLHNWVQTFSGVSLSTSHHRNLQHAQVRGGAAGRGRTYLIDSAAEIMCFCLHQILASVAAYHHKLCDIFLGFFYVSGAAFFLLCSLYFFVVLFFISASVEC